MGDRVQREVETWAPYLEYLRKIMADDEIRTIVKRRTEYEYLITRRSVELIDFLRYIEYELSLEARRQILRDELGVQMKTSPIEFAGLRHIHHVFDRGLSRFKQDVSLWKRYFKFCQKTDAKKQLSRAFARGLAIHPEEESFWIIAADHEFDNNEDMPAARVLLQRGIRLNAKSQRLWREYYRLEWLYARVLKERRKMIDGGAESDADEDDVEVEGNERKRRKTGAEDTDKDGDKGLDIIIKGAIPRTVYQNACKSIQNDIAFRLSFIPICLGLGDAAGVEHATEIRKDCVDSFPHLAHSWIELALAEDEIDEKCAVFEEGLTQFKDLEVEVERNKEKEREAEHKKLWTAYAQLLLESDHDQCRSVCKRAHTCLQSSPELFVVWIKLELASPFATLFGHGLGLGFGDDKPMSKSKSKWDEILELLEIAVTRFPKSAVLWSYYISILDTCDTHGISIIPDGSPSLSLEQLYDRATTNCEDAGIWNGKMTHMINSGAVDKDISTAFRRSIRSLRPGSTRDSMMRLYIDWTVSSVSKLPISKKNKNGKSKIVQSVCDELLQFRPMSQSVFLHCLSLEINMATPDADIDIDRVRRLFEIGVSEFGNTMVSLWLKYMRFELDADSGRSHVVYRRAVQSLDGEHSSNFVNLASQQ